RRRHTILVSDWSSDVCSSDLSTTTAAAARIHFFMLRLLALRGNSLSDSARIRQPQIRALQRWRHCTEEPDAGQLAFSAAVSRSRSEERRVGKEWGRWGWAE